MKKEYTCLSLLNLIFGICAICMYLPYTLEAFDMPGFDWFKFVPKMLKSDYGNALIYFGIFLLIWFIALTFISLLSRPNLPKLIFKLTTIIALVLPLIYVLALRYDACLEFWLDNISKNVKMISYVFLCVSWGSFFLALMYNFTKRNHANLHIILQALVMCILLTLLIAVNGWCGWSLNNTIKIYGILMGLMAIYLPISSIILFLCRKNRE